MKISFDLSPNDSGEDVSCLICGEPLHSTGEWKMLGKLCELLVTVRTPSGTSVRGMHEECARRNGASGNIKPFQT